MKNKRFDFSGIYRWIIAISREYIIALSIYLCNLFILHIVDDLNYINAIFWTILIAICFDKILIYKDEDSNREKTICRIIRYGFIVINFIAFGINIFA